jgi:hypothetical protein
VSAIGWDGKRIGGTQQSCPSILIFDRLKLYSVRGVREVSHKARGVGGWVKERRRNLRMQTGGGDGSILPSATPLSKDYPAHLLVPRRSAE